MLRGELAPRKAMQEVELSRKLGASRPPVRAMPAKLPEAAVVIPAEPGRFSGRLQPRYLASMSRACSIGWLSGIRKVGRSDRRSLPGISPISICSVLGFVEGNLIRSEGAGNLLRAFGASRVSKGFRKPLRSGAVVRNRFAQFVGSQIGGPASVVVVYVGQHDPGVHRRRPRPKLEVEPRWVI